MKYTSFNNFIVCALGAKLSEIEVDDKSMGKALAIINPVHVMRETGEHALRHGLWYPITPTVMSQTVMTPVLMTRIQKARQGVGTSKSRLLLSPSSVLNN